MEDISDPELLRKKPNSDRKVSLYGYVRGTHMKNHITVHIPGKSHRKISLYGYVRGTHEESYYCTYNIPIQRHLPIRIRLLT
jgi:hypothetical protein